MYKLMNDHILVKNMISCVYLFLVLVLVVNSRNIKQKQSEIENSKVTGYKNVNNNINFTPCIDKDCTNHEIKKEHNRHPNHHDKHRHHRQTRGEKNTRKLPLSEGLTLQGKDPSIAQQPYRWLMDSRVPKGVSRLENKIHPNIRHPAKEFMDNLQTILRKIQEKVRNVDSEYISIGSNLRTAMIHVREELELITKENNNVYDSLMDVSQLVRYIYRRAHEHGLTAPVSMASMTYPNLHTVNLRKEFRKGQIADRDASMTYNHAMSFKRRGIQQDAAKSNIMSKVKDKKLSEKFRYFEMYDLQQKVRLILQKVDTLSGNVFIPLRRRLMKHKTNQNNVSERIQHAKYLNGLAYEASKTARNTFELNKKYHQRIKEDRYSRGRSETRRRRSTDNKHIEILAQRVQRRIQQLESVSSVIHSKLSPLVTKGTVVIKEQQEAGAGIFVEIKNILTKVSATMSKLDNKMDEVRVFLNDDKILESRCQELVDSAAGTSEVIDCKKYGVYEGSGSGDVSIDDEDGVFTVKSTDDTTKITSTTVQPPQKTTITTTDSGKTKSTLDTTPSTSSSMTKSTSTTKLPTTRSTTTPSHSTSESITKLHPSTSTTTQSNSTSAATTKSSPLTSTTTQSNSTSESTTKPHPSISTTTQFISSESTTKQLPSTSTTTPSHSTSESTTKPPPATSTTAQSNSTSAATTRSPPSTSRTTQSPSTSAATIKPHPSTSATAQSDSTSTSTLKPSTSTTTDTTTVQSPSATSTTLSPSITENKLTSKSPTTTTTVAITQSSPRDTTLDTLTEENIILGSGDGDSGDGDFQFETTTIKLESTTKEDTITKIEEGSGESETEFSFEEDTKKETEKKGWNGWLWGNDDPIVLYDAQRDFKEKLSSYANKVRRRSDEIHEHWMNVSSKSTDIKELQKRWQNITDNIMYLGSYVNSASGLKISWNTVEPFIDSKMKSLPAKALDIINKAEEAQNRSEQALKVANDKLTKMLQLKQKRLSKDIDNGQGPAFIAELISAVQTVSQNSKALEKLQKINPSPCRGVQNTATRLRNGIAKLRSKIDKAKTITSAIPLTLSLESKDFVSATVAHQSVSMSPTSSIGMCIKPRDENMQIATFYGNSSESYSIYLEDLKPVLKIKEENGGTNVETITFDTSLQQDVWNTILIKRTGRKIEMKINKQNETTEDTVEDSYLPEISGIQPPISRAIIGKTTMSSDAPYFSGCIGDVMVNGRHVTFSKNKESIKPCGIDCKTTDSKSMIFEGDGYAKFSLYLIDASYIDNIHLVFQTLQKEGVLLFINDKLKSLEVVISLSEGAIHIEVSTRRGTTVKRSSKDTYNDGVDHDLKIVFKTDNIDVTTDEGEDTFEQELARQEMTSRIDDGIYLGGLAVQSHSLSGKAKLRSFSGCISTFSISKKEIPLYMIEESKHVYYGKCRENIWRKCIKFSDQSKSLQYSNEKDANKLYIIFGGNSIGTLLHYQRIKGEDFDLTFYVDSMGVEISDNKEDKEYKLLSTEPDKDWHVLSVEDNNDDSLFVSLDHSSITVPYSKPWRWAWSSADLAYEIAVGGHVDDESSSFQGGIASLIINDRDLDLQTYMETANLQNCERLAMIHHDSDKIEKPVC